jgi:integrase
MLTSKPWFRKHDNWWYCTLRVDGKQRQLKLVQGAENECAATAKYHELMHQAQYVGGHGTSVAALCNKFLEAHNDEFAPRTYEWYRYYLQLFCNDYKGDVATLTPESVKAWTTKLGWGDASKRSAYTCLKRLCNWAVGERLIQHSPLANLKRPSARRREKLVSLVEHQAMLARTDRHFHPFLQALRETGARPGELRQLTATMVDLNGGRWILPQHKTVKKTGKPRIIYLSPAMIALTRELLGKHPEGFLFRNRHGRAWTDSAVRCRMRRLRTKLGLPDGTVAYSYRHAFATDALAKGIAPQFVAELLGHQSLEMLSRFYGHVDQKTELLREMATRAVSVAEA